ncbi:MAG: hypothetical protein U9P49_10060, partial [Thermodesulfobacteriota bacterium]|nr:hypothetical protein [Thermodesulfobacteriota bacterium]
CEPCLGSELTCRWEENKVPELEKYTFLNLIVPDDPWMIVVPAKLQSIDRSSLTILLPEISYAVNNRYTNRHICQGITTELTQNAFLAKGELIDFSPMGLHIRVRPAQHCSFNWFNPDTLVTIILRKGDQILFSGICRPIRQTSDPLERGLVLAPLNNQINRFKKEHIRNPRQHLGSAFSIIFDHPFYNKRVQREVCDISTSGLSVLEEVNDNTLLPGMIVPGLTIMYAGSLKIKCTAQVIYRQEKEEKTILCGLAILDMDINTYSRLVHIISNYKDPYAYISTEVDTDALWEFFFDTDFIYPKKYGFINTNREKFKKLYQRLYQENPEIARHFTYQKNGQIYGHASMVKAYNRTWIIHHYAARPLGSQKFGIPVLKQLIHYLNGMCRLPSAKTDYVMGYFRPQNKFMYLAFGEFAKHSKNSTRCSLDLFSYQTYPTLSLRTQLPKGWVLREFSPPDLWKLNRFYKTHSGGLLLDVLCLGQDDPGNESLEETYKALGLTRKWKAYSLICRDDLNAVIVVDQSDMGINLSELLNCIKVLIVDQENLPWEILSSAISNLTNVYHAENVPIIIYPADYVDSKGISYEKQYQQWILNVRYGEEYLEFMEENFGVRIE